MDPSFVLNMPFLEPLPSDTDDFLTQWIRLIQLDERYR